MKGLLSRMFNVIKKCMPKALWEKSKSMVFALASLGYAIQLLLYKDRVVIFDTPSYGNIGDQAILLSEIDYLRGLFLRKKIISVLNKMDKQQRIDRFYTLSRIKCRGNHR